MSDLFISSKKQTSISAQQKFWTVLLLLAVLPTLKSTIYNTSNLVSNVLCNARLRQERHFLEKDKALLLSKIREYTSYSGLKRAIKEEINLVEKNEILIKIVES